MGIPAPSTQGPHLLSDRWAEGEHPSLQGQRSPPSLNHTGFTHLLKTNTVFFSLEIKILKTVAIQIVIKVTHTSCRNSQGLAWWRYCRGPRERRRKGTARPSAGAAHERHTTGGHPLRAPRRPSWPHSDLSGRRVLLEKAEVATTNRVPKEAGTLEPP